MIITPEQIEQERLHLSEEHAYWITIYNSNPEVKRLADEIHHRRMMAPPVCDDCIRIAVLRLKPEETQDKSKPNPDWVDATQETVGIVFNKATGKWEKFIWNDLKYQRIPEGEVEDEEDDDDD